MNLTKITIAVQNCKGMYLVRKMAIVVRHLIKNIKFRYDIATF